MDPQSSDLTEIVPRAAGVVGFYHRTEILRNSGKVTEPNSKSKPWPEHGRPKLKTCCMRLSGIVVGMALGITGIPRIRRRSPELELEGLGVPYRLEVKQFFSPSGPNGMATGLPSRRQINRWTGKGYAVARPDGLIIHGRIYIHTLLSGASRAGCIAPSTSVGTCSIHLQRESVRAQYSLAATQH